MNAILCDVCGTKTDPMAQYKLTPPWQPGGLVPSGGVPGSQNQRDFCSAACLRSWLHEFETKREGGQR